ncbi:MAG: hypothetical protein ACLQVA_13620 [Candidatus Brocadiia bacterium]
MTPIAGLMIIILAVLAFSHFVYEALVAPTIRTRLRFELFRLRDELRWVRLTKRDQLDENVFRDLENGLNTAIRNIDRIDMPLLLTLEKAFETDEEFRHIVEARIELLSQCKLPEVKMISSRQRGIIKGVALTNSLMGTLLLIVPVTMVIRGARTIAGIFRAVKMIASVSPRELDPFLPGGHARFT